MYIHKGTKSKNIAKMRNVNANPVPNIYCVILLMDSLTVQKQVGDTWDIFTASLSPLTNGPDLPSTSEN